MGFPDWSVGVWIGVSVSVIVLVSVVIAIVLYKIKTKVRSSKKIEDLVIHSVFIKYWHEQAKDMALYKIVF